MPRNTLNIENGLSMILNAELFKLNTALVEDWSTEGGKEGKAHEKKIS